MSYIPIIDYSLIRVKSIDEKNVFYEFINPTQDIRYLESYEPIEIFRNKFESLGTNNPHIGISENSIGDLERISSQIRKLQKKQEFHLESSVRSLKDFLFS